MEIISWLAAKADGKAHYFTGKPCPRNHISERFVSTRACVSCMLEKSKAWKLANPEKHAAQNRNWARANPEKAKASKLAEQKRNRSQANVRNQRYAEKNREILREKNRIYGLAYPEKGAARTQRRRAKKLNATPLWADYDAINVIYLYAKIRRKFGEDVEVDHIYPLQGKEVCGLHVHTNLQIIPVFDNRSKSNHFLQE